MLVLFMILQWVPSHHFLLPSFSAFDYPYPHHSCFECFETEIFENDSSLNLEKEW